MQKYAPFKLFMLVHFHVTWYYFIISCELGVFVPVLVGVDNSFTQILSLVRNPLYKWGMTLWKQSKYVPFDEETSILSQIGI